MAAVTAAGGDVILENVIPKHLESISAKMEEMGAEIEDLDDAIRIKSDGIVKRCNIKTMPHPGFPTDMQPQAVACLSLAKGTSIVTEGVWDNRFRYVDQLTRMGAQIQVDGKVAVIEGVQYLTGCPVAATDLRAGAALIVAALAARGTTEIEEVQYIERGYENIVQKLSSLGADIRCISSPQQIFTQSAQ